MRMTAKKRFELTMNGNEVAQYEIIDNNQENLTVYNNLGNVYFSSAMKVCELLNNLADENEQLKIALQNISYQRDEFHRGARENANRVGKLKKENEQLKKELFESRCEYIYDTADITDKLYIDEEIEEMRKNIFEKGVYGID